MHRAGMPAPKACVVGLIYGRDGRPKIKPGWLERLTPEQRAWVEQALAVRGFRLSGGTIVEADGANGE